MCLKRINWQTTWQGITALATLVIAYSAFSEIPETIEKSAQDNKTAAKTSRDAAILEKNNLQTQADSRKNYLLSESIRANEIIKLGNAVSSDKKREAIAILKAYTPEIEIFNPKAGELLFKIQKQAVVSFGSKNDNSHYSEKIIKELSNQFDAIARQSFKVPSNVTTQELMKLKDVPEKISRKTSQQETYKQR